MCCVDDVVFCAKFVVLTMLSSVLCHVYCANDVVFCAMCVELMMLSCVPCVLC